MKLLVAALALGVVVAAAAALPVGHVPLYERDGAPRGWRHVRRSVAHETLSFHVVLPQQRMDELYAFLADRSDPKSPNYSQWMTREQVRRMTAAAPAVRERVSSWLRAVAQHTDGLLGVRDLGDAFHVHATVAFAEQLFHTEVHAFSRVSSDAVVHRHLGALHVPADLRDAIVMVTGVTEFAPHNTEPMRLRSMRGNERRNNNACNTPFTMSMLYNITEGSTVTNAGATQAPYAQLEGSNKDGFGVSDLKQFQSLCGLDNNPITNILGSAAKHYTPRYNDGEANLDVEMLTGLAPDAPTSFYVMSEDQGWMYAFSQEVLNTNDAPLVNSMSYGWWEDEQCEVSYGTCKSQGFPDSGVYIERTNAEFAKLGAAGFTFLAASGDGGTTNPKLRSSPTERACKIRPQYPASSPYVLSVGATAAVKSSRGVDMSFSNKPAICNQCNCNTATYEVTCDDNNYCGFDSGGGFSNVSPRPSYQDTAVEAYLNSGVTFPPSNEWNSTSRGYPDVAAIGGNVATIAGYLALTGGTSASCPIWGAVLTLVNDARLNAGKQPVGFVNPMLYQAYIDNPAIFNDITVGDNNGGCHGQGFHATQGWDPLTGLGSPNTGMLIQYALSLP